MLLILGVMFGFLSLYLYTRLSLAMLFNRVEADLSHQLPRSAGAEVKRVALDFGAASENPALKALTTTRDPSIDDALNLMFTLLYQPNGYQTVIDLGGKLSPTAIATRPEYWFYLAAAFGQKHHALKLAEADQPELDSARENAMDCARRAVGIDPLFKSRLYNLAQFGGSDDDLADFSEDPEFLRIVGRPTL